MRIDEGRNVLRETARKSVYVSVEEEACLVVVYLHQDRGYSHAIVGHRRLLTSSSFFSFIPTLLIDSLSHTYIVCAMEITFITHHLNFTVPLLPVLSRIGECYFYIPAAAAFKKQGGRATAVVKYTCVPNKQSVRACIFASDCIILLKA